MPASGRLDASPLAAAAVASFLSDQFMVLQEAVFRAEYRRSSLAPADTNRDMASSNYTARESVPAMVPRSAVAGSPLHTRV